MTVIESFQGSSGLRINGRSARAPSFIAQRSGSQPCGLKMPTKRGTFTVAWARARGARAGNIESSNGSASEMPAPRRTVRREMCFFVMNILTGLSKQTAYFSLRLPVHPEWRTFRDFEHDCRETIIALAGFAHDRADHRHIFIFHSPAESVRQQFFCEQTYELRRVA